MKNIKNCRCSKFNPISRILGKLARINSRQKDPFDNPFLIL